MKVVEYKRTPTLTDVLLGAKVRGQEFDLATMLEMIVLIYLMSGRLKGLEGRRILLAFGKSAFAAAVMALALVAWTNQAINQPVWLLVIVGVVLGAGVYGIMILVLGVKEARHLLSLLAQRVRQRI